MSKEQSGSGTMRIDALTGVRFFAAFAVFLHHSAQPAWMPDPIGRFMGAGSNGVTFFFMLSGFVLAFNYFQSAAAPTFRSTWNYFVGRFARIYPLYFTTLVVVWVVLGHHSWFNRFVWQAFAMQTWSPNLSIAYGINAPGWSIGVEFFLYACFPFLVLALRPVARNWKALAAIAVVLVLTVFGLATAFQLFHSGLPPTDPSSAHRWLYRTPATRLFDFTLGMIAALLVRILTAKPGTARTAGRWLAPALTWLPVLITVGLMTWSQRSRYYASLDAMWIIPCLMLFVGLAYFQDSRLSRWLSLRPVVFLGEVSFAFYLVHRPILNVLHSETFGAEPPLIYVAKMLGALATVTAVAAVAHLLLERPAQRFLNRHLRLKPRAAAAIPHIPKHRTFEPDTSDVRT